jgi:hypothetical protein
MALSNSDSEVYLYRNTLIMQGRFGTVTANETKYKYCAVF